MKSDEKRCPMCKEAIRKDAHLCKHCGHKFSEEEVAAGRKAMDKRRYGCLAAVAGVLLLGYCVSQVDPAPTDNTQTAMGGAGDSDNAVAGSTENGSEWTYRSERDEMRGRTDRFAELVSDNEQDFEFPYAGGSNMTIMLRKFQKDSTEALLVLEKGQFVCNQYRGDAVAVKFDDGPIRRFGCNDTSDGTADTVFLDTPAAFANALKASKRVTIEAEFFNEGIRQYVFSTAGLKWD